MRPKVSIVIPVYNGGGYFELALKSALAQTYDNIEIIVVNDGSTDGGTTDAIARTYVPRIKYIHQENRGVAGALNTAIQAMNGDFFAWLSHDDLYLPEKIAAQVAFHTRLGKPDAILFSDYDLIDAAGNRTQRVQFDHAKFVQFPLLPLLNGCINGCTLFIPAHILREFGPFNEALRHTQDYDLWNKILGRYEFFHQPRVLIEYRQHQQQGSQTSAAADEGDPLWIRMLEDRSAAERVQLFGSAKRFFDRMAEFLVHTPYKKAANHARERASSVIGETTVSVIIPFHDDIANVVRATNSVLAQTHRPLEVILVNDGSMADLAQIKEIVRMDGRVRLVHQESAGPGAARNRGLDAAKGEYVAFLDADDTFVTDKIERQLKAMEDEGVLASHTSYLVTFPERTTKLGQINSGAFGEIAYPDIIGKYAICTSTVMLHRLVTSSGFRFATERMIGEQVPAWVWLAQRYKILRIDDPLSIIEWSNRSAAINMPKTMTGLALAAARLSADPIHVRFGAEISRLSDLLRDMQAKYAQDSQNQMPLYG